MHFGKRPFLIVIHIIYKILALKATLSIIFKDFENKSLVNASRFEKAHIGNLIQLLRNWKGLFSRFVTNENQQLEFIAVLEDLCLESSKFIDVFHIIIQYLNSDEFNVINDVILKKWSKIEESTYPKSNEVRVVPQEYHKLFLEKMKKFLEQI